MWWGDACVAACGPAVRLLVHQTEVKAIDFKQATGMGGGKIKLLPAQAVGGGMTQRQDGLVVRML